jgi:hypothetical protein
MNPSKDYVAYYKISEDDQDDDVVAMPSKNSIAYPTNMNKNTDDHQMTGGISGD